MPVAIPFIQSKTHYTLFCPLDETYTLSLDVRWNSRDEAWYIDMYQDDDTVIALNQKLVPGVQLGQTSRHAIFDDYLFRVVDTTGKGINPDFDELGTRVKLIAQSLNEPV